MRFDILSVFPGMFASAFDCSLLKKAQEKNLIEIQVLDIRHYTEDRHRMTDDAPYGGGGGMVMKVEPIDRALQAAAPDRDQALVVLLTPQGETFSQKIAEEIATYPRIVLICGHYEGLDERVRAHLVDREISIGDYVLTGGELPAMILVDAVARLIPGVLGNVESAVTDSFATGLLEYPQYTRPAEYKNWRVPDVLMSGHHREIEKWRRREALRRTLDRRPDLLMQADLSADDLAMIEALKCLREDIE
ncbi:MAG: tRNA (guanosine(37)-N1)-methyltransferase TrmD [Pseudomonadota bacterium]